MASPAYLAALRASMQPNVINMPVQGDVDPPPPAVGPGIAPDFPSNDPLARLEADPNGRIAPLTQGQALGLDAHAISPRPPPASPTGEMRPVYNSLGEKIGEEPVMSGGGLLQNPLNHAPPSFNATTGNAIDTATGQDIPKGAPLAAPKPGGPIGYDPSKTRGAEGEPQPAGLRLNLGAGGGGRVVDARAALQPFEDEKAAVRAQMSAEQKLGEDAAVASGLRGQELAQQEAAVRKHAEMQDRDVAQRMDKIEALTKEVSEGKVNPDHFWESRSTGQKIAFGVAAFLGGFVSGFRGGPNEALQHMESAIDRDMAAQRANIENKRGQIGDMRGLLAETYRRYGNMDQAEAAARVIALQQIDQRAQEYAVGSGNELVAAKGQMLQAQINKAEADARNRLAMAGSGGNGAQLKRLQDLTQQNMIQGNDDLATAQKRAIATLGLADVGNVAAFGGKGGKEGTERQQANDESNRQFDAIGKSPVLGQLGFGTATLSKLPPQIAPESNKTKSELQSINLQIIGAASKVLKDNEGRIPPSVLERLHDLEVSPSDTPEQARAKVEGARNFVNSLARQSGADAPTPNKAPAKPPPDFQAVK